MRDLLNIRGLCAFSLASTIVAAPLPAVAEEDPTPAPQVFSDFKKAREYVASSGKYLLIACIRLGQDDSDQLHAILDKNEVYLNGDKAALLQYNVHDDARIQSFREYFKIEGDGFPILIAIDKTGKNLGFETGAFDQERALAFVEDAAPAAVKIPRQLALKRSISQALNSEAERKGTNYHTPFRDWTMITGEKFNGAVVQFTGATLTFKTDQGEFKEVQSGRLTRADLEYLQKNLNPEAPAFP
jgi:hypothetical protein